MLPKIELGRARLAQVLVCYWTPQGLIGWRDPHGVRSATVGLDPWMPVELENSSTFFKNRQIYA